MRSLSSHQALVGSYPYWRSFSTEMRPSPKQDPTPGHKSGPELVHVKEVGSSFCNRQCCGPCRHLTAEMYTVHDNRPIGTYRKGQGLAWCVGCCAATATLVTNVGKGGEQHYDVGNPHGCQCPGCTPLGFTLGGFDFRGDCSCCGHTPCGQYVFNVTNKNTGAEDGSVVKLRQGCADIFYKINKYLVQNVRFVCLSIWRMRRTLNNFCTIVIREPRDFH